jgi:enolase
LILISIKFSWLHWQGEARHGRCGLRVLQQRQVRLDFKTKNNDGSQRKTAAELSAIYAGFVQHFPVISIEDPFDQDDWDAYNALNETLGRNTQIVGDDLLVTNPKRIAQAIEKKSCNALLLKVNQIGSVTEAIKACVMSQQAGWGVMVSHRSG